MMLRRSEASMFGASDQLVVEERDKSPVIPACRRDDVSPLPLSSPLLPSPPLRRVRSVRSIAWLQLVRCEFQC
jgi:hypothetical protein